MAQCYEIGNMLKNFPFYSEEIKRFKKKRIKDLLMIEFYLN